MASAMCEAPHLVMTTIQAGPLLHCKCRLHTSFNLADCMQSHQTLTEAMLCTHFKLLTPAEPWLEATLSMRVCAGCGRFAFCLTGLLLLAAALSCNVCS
jgi:hypothetical protein